MVSKTKASECCESAVNCEIKLAFSKTIRLYYHVQRRVQPVVSIMFQYLYNATHKPGITEMSDYSHSLQSDHFMCRKGVVLSEDSFLTKNRQRNGNAVSRDDRLVRRLI